MIHCTFENNGTASLRHVTVNAIILKDGKILLGKRGTYRGKPLSEYGKWGLLGGYFDRDETLAQAVKREVMEESGWEIDEPVLFRINDNPDRPREDRQNVDMIFIAQAIRQTGTHDEEVRELKWFGLDGMPSPDEIAFDHGQAIAMYRQYIQGKRHIPILG
jgi:ADP-ribose pyrophosphatase YjhB (NUDIX family)